MKKKHEKKTWNFNKLLGCQTICKGVSKVSLEWEKGLKSLKRIFNACIATDNLFTTQCSAAKCLWTIMWLRRMNGRRRLIVGAGVDVSPPDGAPMQMSSKLPKPTLTAPSCSARLWRRWDTLEREFVRYGVVHVLGVWKSMIVTQSKFLKIANGS